jgi:hypothetical protein
VAPCLARQSPYVHYLRSVRCILGVTLAWFALGLMAGVPANGGSKAYNEALVSGHGHRIYAALQHWDWCPEKSEFCASGVRDYAYDPHPSRLPFHRGSLIRIRTGEPAAGVMVTFNRRGPDREIRATHGSENRRRWTLRAPGGVYPKQEIGIVVDYRYVKDKRTYGGRYWFSLAVRKHRHRR